MASTSTLQSSSSSRPSHSNSNEHDDDDDGGRPSTSTTRQAGPLPPKIGELGYSGDSSRLAPPRTTTHPGASTETLVGPHPAERERDLQHDQQQRSERRPSHHHRNNSSSSSAAGSTTTLPLQDRSNGTSTLSLALTTNTLSSTFKRRLKFLALSPKSKPYLLGATPRSVARLALQLAVLAGTIVGWVFAVRYFQINAPQATPANPTPSSTNSTNTGGGGTTTSDNSNVPISGSIFVHVAFTVATLIQLLFLERTVYHIRAERFVYRHPDAVLPSHLNRGGRFGGSSSNPRIAYAPWNRPALPTYAAALGFRGTGDVEDNEVARVVALGSGDVPPLYGHTRGSTLLAYGIGGGVRTSVGSQMTEQWQDVSREEAREGATRGEGEVARSRPVSYGQSEQIEDAIRANQLEDALARLESGGR